MKYLIYFAYNQIFNAIFKSRDNKTNKPSRLKKLKSSLIW